MATIHISLSTNYPVGDPENQRLTGKDHLDSSFLASKIVFPGPVAAPNQGEPCYAEGPDTLSPQVAKLHGLETELLQIRELGDIQSLRHKQFPGMGLPTGCTCHEIQGNMGRPDILEHGITAERVKESGPA